MSSSGHSFARMLAACAAIFFGCAAVSERAHAEERFSFLSTPGKLPKDVVPRAYAVRIAPDLARLTCEGSETIDLEVLKPTRRLVLNAANMEVALASLAGVPGRAKPLELKPELDAKEETLSFSLPAELPPGKYQLALTFHYKLGNQAQGLYYERYDTPSGQKKTMLGTQMEPADARRMFPCWDEPVFRAMFQLTATLPAKLDAVSNMPGKPSPTTGSGPALREHRFEPSPSMASYLVAFFAGEFEDVTGEAEGVQLRILTTEGKRESARYALESTKRLLAFYNDYFGIKYPLPKLDQVAVPGGFGGAMENWGCIGYNETALLFDPKTSPAATKEHAFAVIAHEMAHQWFGDLVTMAWWDNLWLNEGFASWMGTKATDKLNPDWQVWLRAHADKEKAMADDARKTTHPVQQPVKDEREAIDAFDAITYQKGQAIIRMIESWLGEEKFRDGIRRYMAEHKYSNTTTADLWVALEGASGEPVGAVAQSWTTQPGFPVVRAQLERKSAMKNLRPKDPTQEVFTFTEKLSQGRFSIPPQRPSTQQWIIPVTMADLQSPTVLKTWWNLETDSIKHEASAWLLSATNPYAIGGRKRDQRNRFPNLEKLNIGDVGYYRVQYDENWIREVLAALDRLPAADRLNLLGDGWALTEAGEQQVARYFDLLDALRGDTNTAVWEEILTRLRTIDALQFGRPGRAAFQQYARNLLRPQLDRLGWEAGPKEGATDPVLRDDLITALGQFGDNEVVTEAGRRFEAFRKDPASLPADLRPSVFTLVGRYGDARRFDQLLDFARKSVQTEDKQMAYRALAGAADPELAKKALALARDPETMSINVVSRHLLPAAFRGEQRELAWAFVKEHLDEILARLPSFDRNKLFSRFAEPLSDAAQADEIGKLAAARPQSAGSSEIAKTVEAIRFRAEFKARELPRIDEWILQRNAKDRPPVP